MIVSQGQNMPRGGYREGSGGKPKWIHGKTKTIRVPEALAEKIIEYARKLDIKEIEQDENTKATVLTEELKVINLDGIPLKSLDGQVGVRLIDLVQKGYILRPERLQKIVTSALKTKKSL
jgi:hypothetical protein